MKLGALGVAAAMAGLFGSGRIHMPRVVGHDFDLGAIAKARKNNQRAKNQKRMRGMGR